MSGQGPEGLPWPKGEPGACTSAASALKAVGGKLTAAAGDLSGGGNVPGWTGAAAVAYGAMAGAKQASVQGAAEVFTSCAAALTALGELLTDARTEITKQGEKVKEAREAAERAQQAADQAHAHADAMTGLGALTAKPAAVLASALAASAKEHYEQVKEAATAAATKLVHECDAADAATAGEVGEAKVAATAGPGGLPATPAQVDIDPAALAWSYAVHLRFHPDEKYLPADLEAALKAGVLKYRMKDGKPQPYYDLPDDMRKDGHVGAPITYNIVDKDGVKYIVYRVWYAYNDKGAMDDHEGDLELFAVQLGKDDKPAYALYYGHGAPYRVPWDQVQKEGKHPVDYVASGSHASYPAPGHYKIGDVPIPKIGVTIPDTATDQAADGGPRQDAEGNLHPGPDKYPLPKGIRIGSNSGAVANSPAAPNDGGNVEPFGDPSKVHNGKPEMGDGKDAVIRETGKDVLGALEKGAKTANPILNLVP